MKEETTFKGWARKATLPLQFTDRIGRVVASVTIRLFGVLSEQAVAEDWAYCSRPDPVRCVVLGLARHGILTDRGHQSLKGPD